MEAGRFKILFSDLDGTLIFSAKRRRVGDIVVEYKDGAEISCITARQAELLPKIRNIIPVTTRSVEQYLRIGFPEGFAPEYALCDNGGTLLVGGRPDPAWTSLSAGVFAECAEEIAAYRGLLENDPNRSFEIRLVDGLFLFTKSAAPDKTLQMLGSGEKCVSFATGEKVYVIPEKLNKGEAVKRLAKRIGIDRESVFCAGDSLMDVPMLNEADTALFTDDIPSGLVTAGIKRRRPREGFTEFVTEFALSM